jgi:hypothetical protein
MSKEILFQTDRAIAAYSRYFNDFLEPADYAAADWTITTTEAGAGAATEAIGNLQHGVLVITNDNADDDADFLQLAKETFKFVSGKKFRFAMRAKVNEILQCDFVLGLQITDTTPLAVTDGIYFRKDDGDALLDAVVVKDSAATTLTGIKTLAADTYYLFEIYYDGGANIQFKVDGEGAGKIAVGTTTPDDEELAISFGIQQGEATNVKILSIDYIELDQER